MPCAPTALNAELIAMNKIIVSSFQFETSRFGLYKEGSSLHCRMPIESHDATVATTGRIMRDNQAGMIGITSLREAMKGRVDSACRGRVQMRIRGSGDRFALLQTESLQAYGQRGIRAVVALRASSAKTAHICVQRVGRLNFL